MTLMLVTTGKTWRLENRAPQEAVERLRHEPPKFTGYVANSIIREAVEICARKLDIPPLILTSVERTKELARARQITCLVVRDIYGVSRRRIGAMMGGRDQQTIWYALSRARVRRDKDEKFNSDYHACWRAVLFQMEEWAE